MSKVEERTVRCLVKKDAGDFDRAAKLGYAVNLHCAEGYMWLSMPYPIVNIGAMDCMLKTDNFVKVSEVEYR